MKQLSPRAETLLIGLSDPEKYTFGPRLNMRFWAEEVIELLKAGFIALDGTLDQPKVNMTSKGVEAAKALEAQA